MHNNYNNLNYISNILYELYKLLYRPLNYVSLNYITSTQLHVDLHVYLIRQCFIRRLELTVLLSLRIKKLIAYKMYDFKDF